MTKKELDTWYMYLKQVKNGYHMSASDLQEQTRLNHLVMEICHGIHNGHMIEK